jgi:hypothetical protein
MTTKPKLSVDLAKAYSRLATTLLELKAQGIAPEILTEAILMACREAGVRITQ